MKIVFAECSKLEQQYLQDQLQNHELVFLAETLTTNNCPSDVEIISTHTNSQINRQLIEENPKLKLIATRTTGFDHIDLQAASEHGIIVCNVPSYGEITVAEFAFGLILTLSRNIYHSIKYVKETKDFETQSLEGFDLAGKTLGVLGTGKIGQHLIKMAQGFSLNVVGYDAYPNESLTSKLNFRYLPFDELLHISDIISVHLPATPETKHLLNEAAFKKMKKGVIVVNTARGSLIDTKSILQAVDSGIVSAAALDVLEVESFQTHSRFSTDQQELIDINNQLLSNENILITPHNAFNTKEAKQRILQTTVENIQGFSSDHLQNQVPLPKLTV